MTHVNVEIGGTCCSTVSRKRGFLRRGAPAFADDGSRGLHVGAAKSEVVKCRL